MLRPFEFVGALNLWPIGLLQYKVLVLAQNIFNHWQHVSSPSRRRFHGKGQYK